MKKKPAAKKKAAGRPGGRAVKKTKKVAPKAKKVSSAGKKGRPSGSIHPYGAEAHTDLELHLKKFNKLALKFDDAAREMFESALKFAQERHEGQLRNGSTPFVIHPVRVANILMSEWSCDDAAIVSAALLHDVVESTQTTIKEVKDRFGDPIGKLVDGMTMWKGSETYEIYCKRVARGPEPLRLIKCADVIDNLRSWPEFAETTDGLSKWWRSVNDYVLPIAQATYPQAANSMNLILQDPWYLERANRV
jgi:(p)ppGpp synthase/HD superfamily hydrolase